MSCADSAPCPSGLTCGTTDRLCHAGAIECSAMELPPDDAATGTGSGSGSGVGGDAAPGTDAGVAYCNPSEPGLFGCYEFEGNAHNALPEITRLGAGAVATGVTPGIYIGGAAPDNPTDLYVGQLDQLRLFSVARAAQLICTDAGRAHCP